MSSLSPRPDLLRHLQPPSQLHHHLMSGKLFLKKLRHLRLSLPYRSAQFLRLPTHLLPLKPISLRNRLLGRKRKRLQLSPKGLLRHLRLWLALSSSWLLSSHHLLSLLDFRLPRLLRAPILRHSCSTVSTHLTTLRRMPFFNFCSRQTL